jgi:hypothetical protein
MNEIQICASPETARRERRITRRIQAASLALAVIITVVEFLFVAWCLGQ